MPQTNRSKCHEIFCRMYNTHAYTMSLPGLGLSEPQTQEQSQVQQQSSYPYRCSFPLDPGVYNNFSLGLLKEIESLHRLRDILRCDSSGPTDTEIFKQFSKQICELIHKKFALLSTLDDHRVDYIESL